MFKEKSIQVFCQEVGKKTPAPGGGSVAALAASLAQSLLLMVSHLSTQRNPQTFESLRDQLMGYQETLWQLMDEDTQAFNQVMEAFRMSGEKKEEREAAIQAAFSQATFVPLKVMEISNQLLICAKTLVEEGNQKALSDSGVGALMAGAALQGARYNVLINLPSIKDSKKREDYRFQMETLYQEGSQHLSQIQGEMEKGLL